MFSQFSIVIFLSYGTFYMYGLVICHFDYVSSFTLSVSGLDKKEMLSMVNLEPLLYLIVGVRLANILPHQLFILSNST